MKGGGGHVNYSSVDTDVDFVSVLHLCTNGSSGC
jgi:hypothetical protein